MKSVIDQSSLKDFLQEVELSSRNFEVLLLYFLSNSLQALKETKIKTEHHVIDLNAIHNIRPKPQVDEKNLVLRIPRRPAWDASTTPEQLTHMENVYYLP